MAALIALALFAAVLWVVLGWCWVRLRRRAARIAGVEAQLAARKHDLQVMELAMSAMVGDMPRPVSICRN